MNYINPLLDSARLRLGIERDRRVLIRNFFADHVAEALAKAVEQIDWGLTFRDSAGDRLISAHELQQMGPSDRMALFEKVHKHADYDFQFSFFTHSLVTAARQGQTDLLTRFIRWMAGEPFLSLMRDLTGVREIKSVYAQATQYMPGSFLLAHDDHVDAEKRRVAYVINLTRFWRPDWGGLLQFCNTEGDVETTFFPHFNSVAIFLVPQTHCVSYVAPFAHGARNAITGWLIAE